MRPRIAFRLLFFCIYLHFYCTYFPVRANGGRRNWNNNQQTSDASDSSDSSDANDPFGQTESDNMDLSNNNQTSVLEEVDLSVVASSSLAVPLVESNPDETSPSSERDDKDNRGRPSLGRPSGGNEGSSSDGNTTWNDDDVTATPKSRTIGNLQDLLIADDDDDASVSAVLSDVDSSHNDISGDWVRLEYDTKDSGPKRQTDKIFLNVSLSSLGLKTGSIVSFKLPEGTYMSRCEACLDTSVFGVYDAVLGQNLVSTPTEQFRVEMMGQKQFALRGDNGKYLSVAPKPVRTSGFADVYQLNVDFLYPHPNLSVWDIEFAKINRDYKKGDPVPIKLTQTWTDDIGRLFSLHLAQCQEDACTNGTVTNTLVLTKASTPIIVAMATVQWKPPQMQPIPSNMSIPYQSGDWVRFHEAGKKDRVLSWCKMCAKVNAVSTQRGKVVDISFAASVVTLTPGMLADTEHWQIFTVGDPRQGYVRLRTAAGGWLGYHQQICSNGGFAIRPDTPNVTDPHTVWHLDFDAKGDVGIRSVLAQSFVGECGGCATRIADLSSAWVPTGFQLKSMTKFSIRPSWKLGEGAAQGLLQQDTLLPKLPRPSDLKTQPGYPYLVPVAILTASNTPRILTSSTCRSKEQCLLLPFIEKMPTFVNPRTPAENSAIDFLNGETVTSEYGFSPDACWILQASTTSRIKIYPCSQGPDDAVALTNRSVSSYDYDHLTSTVSPDRVWPISLRDPNEISSIWKSVTPFYSTFKDAITLSVDSADSSLGFAECSTWKAPNDTSFLVASTKKMEVRIIPLDYGTRLNTSRLPAKLFRPLSMLDTTFGRGYYDRKPSTNYRVIHYNATYVERMNYLQTYHPVVGSVMSKRLAQTGYKGSLTSTYSETKKIPGRVRSIPSALLTSPLSSNTKSSTTKPSTTISSTTISSTTKSPKTNTNSRIRSMPFL